MKLVRKLVAAIKSEYFSLTRVLVNEEKSELVY